MVGKTAQLTVTVEPADTKYTFESANADIATVSDKGVITGVKIGKTVISVKAGNVTKTADVEVIEAGTMDESRYAGKDNASEFIAPFYIAEQPKIEEQIDLIKVANEAKGWQFKEVATFEKGDKAAVFMAPNDGNKYTDKRFGSQLSYFFIPGKKEESFMAFFSKTFSEKDPVAAAVDGDAEMKESLESVLTLYGFSDNIGSTKLDNGKPVFVGVNTKQFPEGPYQAVLFSNKGKSGYSIVIMIKLIESDQQSAQSVTLNLNKISSLEKLSNR
ncbi:Ig domain protein group 2 domain protein [Porphyromonas asaccharolytica DSM 20707]|uniref:Ig domain protein group 2 domain protein n=2 Tax=Porphyromonas asaccharolytica TaxID=28123 RepID=F4KP15_PORAD|nr:Ig domain protein group 2 domain protein [Porphyromonas asaccharolytica DSM 20707]